MNKVDKTRLFSNPYLALGGVHKLRLQEEGGRWSKKSTFCKFLYHRKCKRRAVGGQKKTNFENIVSERPLSRFEFKDRMQMMQRWQGSRCKARQLLVR